VTCGAGVIQFCTDVKDCGLVARLRGFNRARTTVDHPLRQRHPIARVSGAARHHHQVARLGHHIGGIPDRLPLLDGLGLDLVRAGLVNDRPDRVPIHFGRWFDD
jgi:hypothetical protein